MKINKEGHSIIIISVLLAVAITSSCFIWLPTLAGYVVGAVLLLCCVFTVMFFREPKRDRLADDKLVYAPADGKVVVVEEMEEKEYLGERRIQVSVFMSLSNVHINWFPVGGRVEYFKYHPGKFMVAWHPKSSEDNERTTTVVDTGGEKILFRQIAGLVARRIVSYACAGDTVEQNAKCGFIKFGSRVDVMLPLDCEILVKQGEMVIGSQTPIARLK
jgi:phosphatidylserine decarboxylase